MNLTRALEISEYQCQERTDELTWLAEQASRHNRIVEVGSWQGATARAMADNTSGVLYCVDTWEGTESESETVAKLKDKPKDWLYETFIKNMEGHYPEGPVEKRRVVPIRLSSVNAAWAFKNFKQFDMVFIDADHEYEAVKADIQAWAPLIVPGGLLCGHDRQWDGVRQAIDKLVPNHQVAVGAIWYRPC